ncbi:glycosyltransferase family 2 protein [Enterobacter mori]|uniref:glycosyltransferase family 2 protein n=1 Tax=Enterobacter mori TaxID=539813 RepID=UPI002DBA7CD8|nr:glycosyltransferase family 2 protein [Enterobacter mori]MEB7565806.1 glycosyltransferase family 2 protein [Enterobacter mori]
MENNCATVILNWNGSSDTIACIESMNNLQGTTTDLVVIDNASTPEQFELLSNYFDSYVLCAEIPAMTMENNVVFTSIKKFQNDDTYIYLICAETNYGFSKSCNAGAYLASLFEYKYVLFLNNDTEVEPNFLNILINDLEKDASLLTVIPQIRYFYNKDIIWNCGGTISKYGNRKYYYANSNVQEIKNKESLLEISFATGCCILFRTKEFIDIGMFTERFFFGEEDIELSLRLLRMNKNIKCDLNSLIYHKVGASIKGDRVRLLRKAYIHYLNRLVNMKTFLGFKWWLWMIPSMLKIMVNIIRLNKVTFSEFISFVYSIFIDSLKCNSVDKNKFEQILKNGF